MKVIVYINFVLTLILIGGFVFLFANQNSQSNIGAQVETAQKINGDISYTDACGLECKKQIDTSVSLAVSTISAKPSETVKTIVVTPVPSKAKTQYSYIGLAGPVTTTSTEWYDAPGTDFYLNFNTDYGKNAYATWEAFLKIAHGNGTTFARLYDVTNGIAVNGSEVSVSNASDLTRVISGSLSFWAGNNLYRVQVKSLNTFEATFGSGRVKIDY